MKNKWALATLAEYEFIRFSDSDWDCYAGAEPISKNVPPLICSIERDDFALGLIVDKSGLEIAFEDKLMLRNKPLDYMFPSFNREGNLNDSLTFLKTVNLLKCNRREIIWILQNLFKAI